MVVDVGYDVVDLFVGCGVEVYVSLGLYVVFGVVGDVGLGVGV